MIINKTKKSEFVTRKFKNFKLKLEKVKYSKLKLMEEFDGLVLSSLDFQVGYYSGKQSKKHWLIEDEDLKEMYENIFPCCDRARNKQNS